MQRSGTARRANLPGRGRSEGLGAVFIMDRFHYSYTSTRRVAVMLNQAKASPAPGAAGEPDVVRFEER